MDAQSYSNEGRFEMGSIKTASNGLENLWFVMKAVGRNMNVKAPASDIVFLQWTLEKRTSIYSPVKFS